MKNKGLLKPGFSLLELVIGLLISTILTTISFAIYQQITRSTQLIQKITTNDTKIMILKDRLQQDLLGISPLWFTPSKYEALTKKTTPAADTDEKSEAPKQDKKDEETQKEHNFFYAANNQDDMLNLFSFITTSAMQTYGADNKRCVRVVYLLKKDTTAENKFSLLRKEIDAGEFNLAAATAPGFFYEIASLIKNCSVEYGFINAIIAKNKDDKAKAPDPDKPTEITWLKSWDTKQEKTEVTAQKPIYPKFIKMKLVFMQEKTDHEQAYELCFATPTDTITFYTSFTQKQFYANEQVQAQPKQEPAKSVEPNANNPEPKGSSIIIPINPSQQGAPHAA